MNRIRNAVNRLFNLECENYVFVYTPPKVGSTTLVSSLRVSLGDTYNIVHLHDEVMLKVLTGITDVTINEIIEYVSSIKKNVYVIDIYRTPVERKMSEFFEKITSLHFNTNETIVNTYNQKRLSDRFNSLFPHLGNGEHYMEKYNIRDPILFDFKNKYTVQKKTNITYVKLRLCDSHVWPKILSAIFGKSVVLMTDYQTENKGIGELYKRFKREYKLPLNYHHDISQCRYLSLYYSERERNEYLNTWQHKLTQQWTPYTEQEYKLYLTVSLENQIATDVQREHYADEGCRCTLCASKRVDIFNKLQRGENVNDRISHRELAEAQSQQKYDTLKMAVNKKSRSKYAHNQFLIKSIS